MGETNSHHHDMGNGDEVQRVVAECGYCGTAYAARQWSDGTIQPIGSDQCSCGSTDFRVLDDELMEDSVS